MKRNLKWLGLGGVFATALLFAMNLPAKDFGSGVEDYGLYDDLVKSCMNTIKQDCEVWARAGGGGEAPRGLRSDTKVELAIGERYILAGTIDIRNGDVFLKIDLRAQPWLANRTRVKNPYYRISDNPLNWKKYVGKSVTIVGTSKYAVYNDRGRTLFEIVIVPGAEAVIPALQR